MIDRDRGSYPHIVLRSIGVGSERFIPFGGGNPTYPKPIVDRPAHARSLRENLEEVRDRMEGLRAEQREAGVPDAKTGLVLAVDGRQNERIFAGDVKASSPGLPFKGGA